MKEQDTRKIKDWGRKLNREIRLKLGLADDSRAAGFQDFCNRFAGLVPEVRIERDTEASTEHLPYIELENVRYHVIPAGPELAPFLEFLDSSVASANGVSKAVVADLERIDIPAPIKIYIAPQCPFCPTVVGQFLSVAGVNPHVRLTVVDGTLFSERARKDKVQSVPTLILDDQFRWTGTIPVEEVVSMMLTRDPAQLSDTSLRGLIEEGRAPEVAQMMVDGNRIFPAFLELLVHAKWPVRMGAMVVFEYILEKDRGLAAQVLDQTWVRFSGVDERIQGDILYLLGQSGLPESISRVKAVVRRAHSRDVQEAARDALNQLESGGV